MSHRQWKRARRYLRSDMVAMDVRARVRRVEPWWATGLAWVGIRGPRDRWVAKWKLLHQEAMRVTRKRAEHAKVRGGEWRPVSVGWVPWWRELWDAMKAAKPQKG